MASEDEVLLNFEAEDKSTTDTTEKVIKSLEELDSTIKRVTNGLVNFNEQSNKISKSNKQTENSTRKATNMLNAYRIATAGIAKKIKDWTLEAAAASGVQTRFNALFDNTTEELKNMQEWVDKTANSLYLDAIQVENVASKFRLLTGTMGINNSKSIEMTKNMTMLAYDLAAVTGHQEDVSVTMNAINSALAGQTKALAKYGIALNQNSLQETLNAAGINKKVSALNSAQKAELIYTQIMKSTAGMQGYYAKTLMSPANAANIIKTQFNLLAREIGNVFIPILMALVPIVVSVTNALRSLAQMLASILGLNIDFTSYAKGLDIVGGGIGSIGDEADETAGKVKNMIRDFDDLHVINFDTGSGKTSGIGGAGGESLFGEQEYAKWEDALDNINEKIKGLIPIIKGVITGLAAWKIASAFMGDLVKTLGLMDKISIIAGAILISVGAWTILSGIEEGDLKKKLLGILEVGLGAGIMFKSWKAGVLGLEIAATLTIVLSSVKWITDNFEKSKEALFGKDKDKLNLGETLDVANYSWGRGLVQEIGTLNNIDPEVMGAAWDDFWKRAQQGYSEWLVKTGQDLDTFSKEWQTFTDTVTDSSSWEQYWQDVKTGAENWKKDTIGIWDAFKTVTGQKLSEAGEQLSIKFEEMKTNASTKLTELKDNAILKWEELKSNVRTKIEEMKTNISNKFIEIKTNVTNRIEETKNNISTKFENIKKTITEKMNAAREAVKTAIDKIKSFFNFEWKLPDIKIPHFGIDWDVSGAIGQAFQNMGLPGLPKIKVDWYELGGFPDKGQLFIANEREPELIGSMGNRSVVANNAQITEGIRQAAYSAFKQAFNESASSFGGDTLVYVGDTQITDVITKKKSIQDRRFGR